MKITKRTTLVTPPPLEIEWWPLYDLIEIVQVKQNYIYVQMNIQYNSITFVQRRPTLCKCFVVAGN